MYRQIEGAPFGFWRKSEKIVECGQEGAIFHVIVGLIVETDLWAEDATLATRNSLFWIVVCGS